MTSLMEVALKLIKEIGGETYIVGGAVRDMVMGIEPHDIDIATNAPMEYICGRFKTHDIGKNKDFGIVVVEYEGHNFEVAHFRVDGTYSDNRRPDEVKFVETITEDLARRDFTINAMAYDGEKIIDPYGGQEDIKKGWIRFVGNAKDRIAEDKLRIFRAYRFAARFKFNIVDEKIMYGFGAPFCDFGIAQERVTDEVKKTASYGGSTLAWFLDKLTRNDIRIEPLIQTCVHPQGDYHHPEGNVYQHVLHCLSACTSKDYLTVLAVLFHDIGKVNTLGENMKGNPTFYGHDKVGADMMIEIGNKLKLSNDEVKAIQFCCNWHMKWRDVAKPSLVAEMLLSPYYDMLCEVTYSDEMGRLYASDDKKWYARWAELQEILATYKDKEAFDNRLKEFVTGENVIELRPGITGKDIGRVKNATIEYIVDNDFTKTIDEVNEFIIKYVL